MRSHMKKAEELGCAAYSVGRLDGLQALRGGGCASVTCVATMVPLCWRRRDAVVGTDSVPDGAPALFTRIAFTRFIPTLLYSSCSAFVPGSPFAVPRHLCLCCALPGMPFTLFLATPCAYPFASAALYCGVRSRAFFPRTTTAWRVLHAAARQRCPHAFLLRCSSPAFCAAHACHFAPVPAGLATRLLLLLGGAFHGVARSYHGHAAAHATGACAAEPTARRCHSAPTDAAFALAFAITA